MARLSRPPSQTWKTFLQNHAEAIAAIDMCVIPTLTFDLSFAFLIVGHGGGQLLWFEVARHPTAEWLARQITEAFPLASPAYLVRDNDRAWPYLPASGEAMGIRDRRYSCIAVAKWNCGTSDRHTTSRLPGPNSFAARRTYADSFRLCSLLQSSAHALGITERCAVASISSGLALLSPSRSWLGCITNMSGYDFRKGQVRLTDDDHLIQALAAQCVSAIGILSSIAGAEWLC